MNREQAEKLLAALLFDELDAASKEELTDYLKTDDELRERLTDMRMAVKVTSDALKSEPKRVLNEDRLEHLSLLAGKSSHRTVAFSFRFLIKAAAVFAVIALPALLILMPSLQKAKVSSSRILAVHDSRSLYDMELGAGGIPSEESDGGTIYNRQEQSAESEPQIALGSEQPQYGMGGRGMSGMRGGNGSVVSDGLSFNTLRSAPPPPPPAVSVAPPAAPATRTPISPDASVRRTNPAPPPPRTAGPEVSAGTVIDSGVQVDAYADKLSTDRESSQLKYQYDFSYERLEDTYQNSKPIAVDGSVSTPLLGDLPEIDTLFKASEMEAKEDLSKLKGVEQKTKDNEPHEIAELSHDKAASETPAAAKPEPLYAGELNVPLQRSESAKSPQVLLDVSWGIVVDELGSDLPLGSRFKAVPVNPWVMTERDALSTFALDVDTASYTLCRRYISSGYLPPAGAVRMEEFINYFNYQYPQQSDRPFRVYAEAAASPFAGQGKNLTLLKIGVKARTLGRDQQKPAHLVFVIDSSASMGQPERLPLIQQALNLLMDNLTPSDRITLITCSDQAHLLLDAVPLSQQERIRQVINAIQPSGTTNLLAGLQLGYEKARRAYSARQINRIVLCSDGVANVGQTEAEAVLKAVAEDRKQGITMTCVGVGYGTYNDAFMESLANQGDGSYVFLDSLQQAQRVFVEQLAATLHTVAKDARIQVSFNPERVRRYRLIGYENRDIEDARFRDDTIDAGEVGSGQCSTALYELELLNAATENPVDDLGTVFVRYRNVETSRIEEISSTLENSILRTRTVEDSPYFYLAAAAAQFAEVLRQSEHTQGSQLKDIFAVAAKVCQVLPLDHDVSELAELIRRSENLPRAQ